MWPLRRNYCLFVQQLTAMAVFGMGVDLSTFLAIYGAAVDGDGLKWSIGGPDSRVGLSDLLGKPQGISGSHNKYEGDGSPTRCDLYQCGNAVDLNMELFQQLYDSGKAEDNYDLQLLTDLRTDRVKQCKDENPYCFFAPFAGVIAQPAAWSFVYRFMSNKSEEFPAGKLNGEVLKSFYGVTGEDGNFQYNRGHEARFMINICQQISRTNSPSAHSRQLVHSQHHRRLHDSLLQPRQQRHVAAKP